MSFFGYSNMTPIFKIAYYGEMSTTVLNQALEIYARKVDGAYSIYAWLIKITPYAYYSGHHCRFRGYRIIEYESGSEEEALAIEKYNTKFTPTVTKIT